MATTSKPEILDQSIRADAAEYLLYIPATLEYFTGHFPGHPILPGVTQIHWAVELSYPLQMQGSFKSMERLKFMRLIVPESRISLALNREVNRNKEADGSILNFRYYDPTGNITTGRLSFSAP